MVRMKLKYKSLNGFRKSEYFQIDIWQLVKRDLLYDPISFCSQTISYYYYKKINKIFTVFDKLIENYIGVGVGQGVLKFNSIQVECKVRLKTNRNPLLKFRINLYFL